MVHYTCDMCGKPLLADEDTRYVVKIEVHAAYDPMEITDEDLAKDQNGEIQDLLDQMADMDAEKLEEQVYKSFRFDLCPSCQAKYLQDPLFRSVRKRIPFGDN
ncbi:MAG TPA: hypothetical protein VM219_07145 [Phycisphaerae bacterium]|nr:hypothetical protein [Phycisphaerae bacterium]HUS45792.1 hypothetical protein [Phycisphaerae bacterium]